MGYDSRRIAANSGDSHGELGDESHSIVLFSGTEKRSNGEPGWNETQWTVVSMGNTGMNTVTYR